MSIVTDYLRELHRASVNGWNRFWFAPTDPATLGLIRLFAGAMIFYTHLVWTLDLEGFFGAEARIPASFVKDFHGTPFGWSYLLDVESTGLLWTLHIVALVILAMFALGLFSRVTSVLAFLITVAYVHRVPGALFGLDQINGLLALYLMIGPSGAAYSLDSLIGRARLLPSLLGKRSESTAVKILFSQPAHAYSGSVTANIAIRLIQIHMCIVYLFAGFGKLLGPTWWDGTAMWGAFANYEYQSLDMTWLAAYPLVINFLSHLTIFWECSYIALVWPRLTRPLIIALAIPLHLGIAFCMGMITFGLVMLIGNLAFVSPALVRAATSSLSPWEWASVRAAATAK